MYPIRNGRKQIQEEKLDCFESGVFGYCLFVQEMKIDQMKTATHFSSSFLHIFLNLFLIPRTHARVYMCLCMRARVCMSVYLSMHACARACASVREHPYALCE